MSSYSGTKFMDILRNFMEAWGPKIDSICGYKFSADVIMCCEKDNEMIIDNKF